MPAPAQLPLPFIHRPTFATDFLEAPSNSAALAWLARTEDWPDGRLAVWGEAGCGKSHLLHLWANRSAARYFSGPILPAEAPVTGLAIDDSDRLADETVLLHTLNAALEARVPVLLAARLPPARWQTRLADLASRLRAVTAVEIAQAEDSLLRVLFARLLTERQLTVPMAIRDWLLLRLPRTPAVMREAAARLDRAVMATGGAVNWSVAASVLQGLTPEDG